MRHISRYLRNDDGVIAPIAAFIFMMLMGMAGLGVDVGMWMNQKRVLQTAADAAALGAAYELAHGFSHAQAEEAALREAQVNGYNATQAASPIDIVFAGDEDSEDEITTTIQVTLRQRASSWFSRMLNEQTVVTRTSATAEVESIDGVYCMLSLDPDEDEAIRISGNVTIDAQGCGIASNSRSDSSLAMNGNVFVNVGDVALAGNVEGGGTDFHYTSLRTGVAQQADPYAGLDLDHTAVCSAAEVSAGMVIRSTADLLAAPHFPVLCGNIMMKGADIVAPSNTYIIEAGDLSTNGQGSLTALGSTLIFTNSPHDPTMYGNLNSTGGFDINISAPTTGDWAGIAIYQDRNAPDDGTNNKLTGNGGIQVDGVIYTPTRSIEFGGNHAVTSSADVCSKIISKSIWFHGTPTIGSNCTDKATKSIGTPAVRLIL